MPRYRNVSGIAREVSKRYLNVDGIAREITKGYKNIDGVAREYWSSGIGSSDIKLWKKYSVTTTTNYTWTDTPNSSKIGTIETRKGTGPDASISIIKQYAFSTTKGWYGTKGGVANTEEEAIGYYFGDNYIVGQYIAQITAAEITLLDSGSYSYTLTGTVIEYAKRSSFVTYSKGLTDYGVVTATEGELPEEGTYVEGSDADGYYVINIDGTNYYYEKL